VPIPYIDHLSFNATAIQLLWKIGTPRHSRSLGEPKQMHSAWHGAAHTTVPNKAPTPAVNPIASAPQKVTRIAPTAAPAPPAPAANAPKSARNSSEVPGTRITRLASGTKAVVKMDKFKFADTWDQIAAGRDKIFPFTASKAMADRVKKILSRRLGPGLLKEAA
jgi:hypothetical protein